VRDAILDSIWALVTEHGLMSVTMSQIAEETGIGRARLYKYFPDVEAILAVWHERHVAGHLEHLAELRDQRPANGYTGAYDPSGGDEMTQRPGCNPARVNLTSRWTAALDGRLPAAVSVEAVARELVRRDIIPKVAGLCDLAQQVSDQIGEVLLPPGDVLTSA